jgi:hypothetical protein
MALVGLILLLIGAGIMYFARQTDGVSAAVLFLLGLVLAGIGCYGLFCGQCLGARNFLP